MVTLPQLSNQLAGLCSHGLFPKVTWCSLTQKMCWFYQCLVGMNLHKCFPSIHLFSVIRMWPAFWLFLVRFPFGTTINNCNCHATNTIYQWYCSIYHNHFMSNIWCGTEIKCKLIPQNPIFLNRNMCWPVWYCLYNMIAIIYNRIDHKTVLVLWYQMVNNDIKKQVSLTFPFVSLYFLVYHMFSVGI